MSRFIEPYLFDVPHNHRRRRRIFGAEGRYGLCPSRPSRRIGLRTPAGWGEKSRNWPTAAPTGSARTLRSGITSTAAWLRLGCSRHFADQFTGRRIVFMDGIEAVDGVPDVHDFVAVH